MNKKFLLQVYTTSLTIFAMLFGAGNLMFPLRLGMEGGSKTFFSFAGFLITGVILPLIGILVIIGFKGSYERFFARLGPVPGFVLVLFCMMIIGPFVVMPRIVTLSYEMLQPFLPIMPVWFFAILFLSLVFVATYKPGRLLDIIGKLLSPLKVFSLLIIILLGVIKGSAVTASVASSSELFFKGINFGYYTLDLLCAIFFGAIIVSLLTRYAHSDEKTSVNNAVAVATVSSVCAALLLAAVYAGMSLLGAYHGHGLEHLNEGQIFSAISMRVIGSWGAALIGFTVFLACFTTTVSLAAVVADYVRRDIVRNKISYPAVMALILSVTAFFSYFGLTGILKYSIPVIIASYPIFIVITLCNALFLMFNVKIIKIPTLIIFIVMGSTLLFNTLHGMERAVAAAPLVSEDAASESVRDALRTDLKVALIKAFAIKELLEPVNQEDIKQRIEAELFDEIIADLPLAGKVVYSAAFNEVYVAILMRYNDLYKTFSTEFQKQDGTIFFIKKKLAELIMEQSEEYFNRCLCGENLDFITFLFGSPEDVLQAVRVIHVLKNCLCGQSLIFDEKGFARVIKQQDLHTFVEHEFLSGVEMPAAVTDAFLQCVRALKDCCMQYDINCRLEEAHKVKAAQELEDSFKVYYDAVAEVVKGTMSL